MPDEILSDVADSLPRDLKKSKELSPEAIAWLRDNRRFHVVVSLNKLRHIFYNNPNSDARTVAREHIDLMIRLLTSSSDQGVLTRFKKLRQESLAKAFNVDLLSDIYILGVLFAVLTVIIGRDRPSEIIGWFPDRDNMTNWCDGIWRDYTFGNTGVLCDHFDINITNTKTAAGAPDRSGEKEIMWFDYLIRGRIGLPVPLVLGTEG